MKTALNHAQSQTRRVSINHFLILGCIAASISACSGGEDDTEKQQGPLRPGVEDSSKIFKGTPSKAENDFWAAIRNGDETGRVGATAQLKADAAKDPTNGYSAFLAAVNAFMPNAGVVRSLAARQPPPPSTPFPDDTIPLLQQALAHLTDPLYIGFSATLLAGIQAFTNPGEAPTTQALAVKNNVPAGSVGQLNTELRAGNLAGARDVMSNVLDFCNGAALDRANPNLDAYIDRANAADLVHRECYSGFHATHGTEGILFVTGDLFALSGNPQFAQRYYAAAKRATNYPTWPLRPVLDRRISGEQPAAASELEQTVACSTCHVSELK